MKIFDRKLAILASGFTFLIGTLIFPIAHATAQSGKKWIDMDYGPYMSHSFQVGDAPGRNIAYKGIKIHLGENGCMLFDEDLLRWAGGWEACDLDWRNVIYDGSHGTHPKILGSSVFHNPVIPGWSLSEDFKDPRQLPYGPLEKSTARFQGLYRHGKKLVVKFNVGESQILESASLQDGFLKRTTNLTGNEQDLITQILFTSEAKSEVLEKDGTTIVYFGKLPVSTQSKKKPPREITDGLIGSWFFDESGNQIQNGIDGKKVPARFVKLTPGPRNRAMAFNGKGRVDIERKYEMGSSDFSIVAWVKTVRGGTIAAKAPASGKWKPNGKTLFVDGGRLVFDVGWVGNVRSRKAIGDGKWHAVGISYEAKTGKTQLYVDGRMDTGKTMKADDNDDHVFRLGYTSENFAKALNGSLDDVRFYNRALKPAEFASLSGGVSFEPQITGLAISGVDHKQLVFANGNVRLKIPAGTSRFSIRYFKGNATQKKKFETSVGAHSKSEDLSPLLKGGPSIFPQSIATKGTVSKESAAYVTDELTLPHENPWKSWMRIGGFDFFSDPTKAALCTWSGDVWIVSGIQGDFEKLTWRRIASGMFQPLGLKIVNDEIFVGCRNQITRLVDLNGDGETDFYETFNNDHQVTEHFHEFAMDLQTDPKGNFYYAKSARHALDSVVPHHGTLIRVSPDGSRSEIVCNGFRAANGVGIGPNGQLATSDQEGHWTPANRINLVTQNGFYGNMYSFHRGKRPTGYDPPLVWLPKNVDRSPAAQLWCESEKWGPFKGKMLSTSYGTGKLWHVLNETVDGKPQGGVVQFPVQFPTGVMRGRFHPVDGQLYTCGLFGWSSNQTRPGGFYRVRYTGRPVNLPIALRTAADGIYLTFSDPLEKEAAEDSDNFSIEQWNYRWTKNYGSAHYSVENPKRKGQDEVEVWETSLSADRKTVFMEIEDLQPVMQMQISYTLKSASGQDLKNTIWMTLNSIPE